MGKPLGEKKGELLLGEREGVKGGLPQIKGSVPHHSCGRKVKLTQGVATT